MSSKESIRKQLEAIRQFMASEAYKSYLFTKKTDLKTVEDQILSIRPDSLESIAALCELHGVRSQLLEDIGFFESSCGALEEQLEQDHTT